MLFYSFFDFGILRHVSYLARGGKKNSETTNDIVIMADTETSKEIQGEICKNYVVAWTISMRAYGMNIATLYGTRPSEMVDCINRLIMAMRGDKTIIYIHNMAYDWMFLRKFFLAAWGTPLHQLNTKPHYPVVIEFANGIVLKDSLILSQRKLDKWAKDLDVEHKKASGAWDYDRIRHQGERLDADERTYIEHDTLAGVECIDKTKNTLGKRINSMPFTATGIPREQVRKLASERANRGRDVFKRIVPPYHVQQILERCFHGGFTHANRHYAELVLKGRIEAYDEASAYPFVMLVEKYPMGRFAPFTNVKPQFILDNCEDHAYIFKLILVKPRIKSEDVQMPALQLSKAVKTVNAISDNGRILCAEYVEIYLNEIDLAVIMDQYDYDHAACIDVYITGKDYLPRWYTDYVYECFREKTMLKGGDPTSYSIAKGKLNSLRCMECACRGL